MLESILDFIPKITKAPAQTLLILIGAIFAFVGFLGPEHAIMAPNHQLLAIVSGLAFTCLGFLGALLQWKNFRGEIHSRSKSEAEISSIIDAEFGAGLEAPVIHYQGWLKDKFLGTCGEGDIAEMPSERQWKYLLEEVEIRILEATLSIHFETTIIHPKQNKPLVFECQGKGPYADGVAHLLYNFREVETGAPNWIGTMVLRVPRVGSINGYWMTTNVNKDDKFPIGVIHLDRKF